MNYQKLRNTATKIEDLVDEGLAEVEGTEPIRTPLLNLKSAAKHLRDAIAHAKGQERDDA